MLVAIDARALRRPMAGIGRYVWHLGRALEEHLPEATFVVVGCRAIDVELPGSAPRWRTAWDDAPGWGSLPRLAWLRWRCGAFLRRLGVDVFWGSSLQIPRFAHGIPTLLTVYDLVHLIAPATLGWRGRIALNLFLRGDVARADAVVAISQGTATRLAAWSGRHADAVVRPAVDAGFIPAPAERIAELRRRLDLPGRFVLALGTHEPRKNLQLLAEAFALARDRGALGDLRLVVAGRPGWRHAGPARALAALGGLLTDVGYVADRDLPVLLSAAEALLFPSAYEGFGMPAAEAASCGTPVVCLDSPELREACPGAIRLAGPDRDAFASVITGFAGSPAARRVAYRPPWSWESEAVAQASLLRRLATPSSGKG